MLFIIKELTYPVLYIKYLITSLQMATFYHASHFRRQSKIILLTKQLLLWRWPSQFKTTNVIKFGRHQILVTYRISNYQLLYDQKLFLLKPTTKFRLRFKITAVEIIIVTFGDDSLTDTPKIVKPCSMKSQVMHQTMTSKIRLITAEHVKKSIKSRLAKLCLQPPTFNFENSTARFWIFENFLRFFFDVRRPHNFENWIERSTFDLYKIQNLLQFLIFFQPRFCTLSILINNLDNDLPYPKTTPRRHHRSTTLVFKPTCREFCSLLINKFIYCKSEILIDCILTKRKYSINFIILILSLLP